MCDVLQAGSTQNDPCVARLLTEATQFCEERLRHAHATGVLGHTHTTQLAITLLPLPRAPLLHLKRRRLDGDRADDFARDLHAQGAQGASRGERVVTGRDALRATVSLCPHKSLCRYVLTSKRVTCNKEAVLSRASIEPSQH